METDTESTDGPVEFPTDFAERLAAMSGLADPPATLEEWLTALSEQFSESDQTVGPADMYSEAPTRHEVHVNDRVRYSYCVVDALAAAVMEDQDTVTVRSIDPVTDNPVTFVVSEDSLQVSPEAATLSFGGKLDRPEIGADDSFVDWSTQEDHSVVEATFCEYTNAFETEENYEQWAADSDSSTIPLSPAKLVPLIQQVTRDRD